MWVRFNFVGALAVTHVLMSFSRWCSLAYLICSKACSFSELLDFGSLISEESQCMCPQQANFERTELHW